MRRSSGIEGFANNLAFLVAIDDYIGGIPKLRTPVADAKALAKLLTEEHGFNTELMLDSTATLAGLRAFLSDLPKRIGSNDRVIFYFAGHGTTADHDEGPTGYILPQDAASNSDSTYLPMLELNAALSSLPCRHMLVVLDCCFAGAFRWASTRYLALAPERLHQERYRWFISDPAWQAIASAAYDQRALDVADGRPLGMRDDREEHSPFALALIDGLQGAADRAPVGKQGDGVITATELYQHLVEALLPQNSTDFRQTPIFWPLKKDDKGQFVFLVPGTELDLPPAPPLDADANPWRGLSSYNEGDAEIFYGRKAASDRLLERVLGNNDMANGKVESDSRFIVVTGPSGIGKSSLVKAGLLPRLPEDLFRSIVVRPSTPGPSAFASLAAALKSSDRDGQPAPDEKTLQTEMSSLAEWVKAQRDHRQIVLVIDQAEELITASGHSDQLQEFCTLLLTALDQTPTEGLRIVLTVRSEFEPQFSQTALNSRWAHARYLVPQMTQDELRRVIEGPAAVKVMRIEPAELVDTLVNEVVNMPGALPVLSFALSQMYRNYLARHATDRALTATDYDALAGGVTGSLRTRANQVIGEGNDEQRAIARRVLERFVSIDVGEFTRRRVPGWEFDIDDANERASVFRLLKRLDEELLVVTDSADGTTYFELAHDALILGWSELHEWVRRDAVWIGDLRRLTTDANEWDKARRVASASVWDDKVEADTIRRLRAANPHVLNRIEEAFADASLKRAARNQIIRWSAIAALAVLAIAASIGFFIARTQTTVAKEQTELAKQGETRAKTARDEALLNQSRLLQKEVQNNLDANDNVTAMLVGLEGLPDTASGGADQGERPYLASLEGLLFSAVFRNRERPAPVAETEITAWTVSSDGAQLVTGSKDGHLDIWNLGRKSKIAAAARTDGATAMIGSSDDESLIVAAAGTDTLMKMESPVLVNSSSGAAVPGVAKALFPISSAAMSPDGKYFVVGYRSAAAGMLIPVDRPNEGVLLEGHLDGVHGIIFNPDSSRFVTRSDSDLVPRLWSNTGELISSLAGNFDRVTAVTFSPDGTLLATASENGIIMLWHGSSGVQLDVGRIEKPGISVLTFDKSSRGLFIGLNSGEVFRLDVDAGGKISTVPPKLLLKQNDRINSLTLDVTGNRLLVASRDGILSIWSPSADIAEDTSSCPQMSAVGANFIPNTNEILLICGDSRGLYYFEFLGTDSPNIKERIEFKGGMRVDSVQFSGDGRHILVGSEDRKARILNVDSASVETTFGGEGGPVENARFTGDGNHAVLSTAMGGAQLWNISGKPTHVVTFDSELTFPPKTLVTASASSPDARYIVTAKSTDEGVKITAREVISGKVIQEFVPSQSSFNSIYHHEINQIAFNADGTRFAFAISWIKLEPTNELYVFSFDNGKLTPLPNLWHSSSGKAISVKFVGVNQLLVMSETEVSLLALNSDNSAFEVRFSVDVDTTLYGDAAISPSGQRVYVATGNVIRLFDFNSGAEVGSYQGHTSYVTGIDVSPAGDQIVSGSADGTVRVWRAFPSTQDIVAFVKTEVNRCLTTLQRTLLFLPRDPPDWCIKMRKWPFSERSNN